MGYHLHSGGRWSGDYLVLDADKLNHAEDYRGCAPVRVKDIVVPSIVTFPVATGQIRQPDDGTQDAIADALWEEEDIPELEPGEPSEADPDEVAQADPDSDDDGE